MFYNELSGQKPGAHSQFGSSGTTKYDIISCKEEKSIFICNVIIIGSHSSLKHPEADSKVDLNIINQVVCLTNQSFHL